MAEIKKYQCDICHAEFDDRDAVKNTVTITNDKGHTWSDVCAGCVEFIEAAIAKKTSK